MSLPVILTNILMATFQAQTRTIVSFLINLIQVNLEAGSAVVEREGFGIKLLESSFILIIY